MPEKKEPKPPYSGVRMGISLNKKVWDWAEELMRERGYDNVSAFMADLIRAERDRLEEQRRRDEERELKLRQTRTHTSKGPDIIRVPERKRKPEGSDE